MPSQRFVKPEYFTSPQWTRNRDKPVSHTARLLGIACLQQADVHGRFELIPMQLHAAAFPFESGVDVAAALAELIDCGFLTRYEVGGRDYIHIPGFAKHQAFTGNSRKALATASRHPEPPNNDASDDVQDTYSTGTVQVQDASHDVSPPSHSPSHSHSHSRSHTALPAFGVFPERLERSDQPKRPMGWAVVLESIGWPKNKAHDMRLFSGLFTEWCNAQLSVGEFELAATLAHERANGQPRSPRYYQPFVAELIENRGASAATEKQREERAKNDAVGDLRKATGEWQGLQKMADAAEQRGQPGFETIKAQANAALATVNEKRKALGLSSVEHGGTQA
jgi:hypothetical protein